MTDPETGEAIRLEPLVTRILAANPSPFTYTGTETYLVGTSDVAVIDPGPDLPEHIDALLRAVDNRRVVAI
ncbi:MAG TPA: MBL fold metallo-hydrolase, partial [Sphingomonas sp.]|nr:MBL fold metallo-hydrolase [Sphingomonas sp.]